MRGHTQKKAIIKKTTNTKSGGSPGIENAVHAPPGFANRRLEIGDVVTAFQNSGNNPN
jgi:hypothetical protein